MRRKNILLAGLIIFITSFIFMECSKNTYNNDNSGGGTSGSNKVYMKNSTFSSANLTITVGGTVQWINDDNMVHTVTSDNGRFNSGDIQANGSFSNTFSATGVYPYHCIYHSGMTGTIVVVTK